MNVFFASYGNDSCALIQWAAEHGLTGTVLYNDTGWAGPGWERRITDCEKWARGLGLEVVRTKSMGLFALAKKKKAWPRNGMQFCTTHLKQRPSLEWLDEHDPAGVAVCYVGVRREESRARAEFPAVVESSEMHGGREVRAPLVGHTTADRDELLEWAGIVPLPHRSMECWPCVNGNKADLLTLTDARIDEIERLEAEMGFTSNGKPRVMFRPAAHKGGVGIREAVRWAKSDRYHPDQMDMCLDGWCGV